MAGAGGQAWAKLKFAFRVGRRREVAMGGSKMAAARGRPRVRCLSTAAVLLRFRTTTAPRIGIAMRPPPLTNPTNTSCTPATAMGASPTVDDDSASGASASGEAASVMRGWNATGIRADLMARPCVVVGGEWWLVSGRWVRRRGDDGGGGSPRRRRRQQQLCSWWW